MRARGVGDATLDVKWRFLEAGAASLALRAGLAVPTGNAARGLGTGNTTAHGLVAAANVAAPLAFHANLGYAKNRAESEDAISITHPPLRYGAYRHASDCCSPTLRWTPNPTLVAVGGSRLYA